MNRHLGREYTDIAVILKMMAVFLSIFLIGPILCQGVTADKQETVISIGLDPEDPSADASFTIAGVLSDALGYALGNKRIILESSQDGDLDLPFESLAVTNTDREGRYQFYRGSLSPPEYIRVKFNGNAQFAPAFSEIIPVKGADLVSAEDRPSRYTGGLVLIGNPNGAMVILDGEMRGVTPFMLGGIAEGPHLLEIGKPGYQNQTMEIYIARDQKTTYSFTLPPVGSAFERSGLRSVTGIDVYDNASSSSGYGMPLGDPIFTHYESGISVAIYGNNTTGDEKNRTQITTSYSKAPFGDGFSMNVIITSDDTPFR